MKEDRPIKAGLRQLPIRPVYLVTAAHQGEKNIITIGMFAIFSGIPPLVGVGIKPSRYSYGLIEKSREYVVNVVDQGLLKAVRICGEHSGDDTDKFRLADLTPVQGSHVKAPCIKESTLNVECKVVQTIETGDHVWFIGEVLAVRATKDYDWKNGALFKWIGDDGLFYKVGPQTGQY